VIDVATLGHFAAKDQEEFRRATADVLRGEAAKRDRLHLALKGYGDGIRLRLAIDVPALKLMVVLGNQAQK
jgi:hypothetical protein